MMGCYWECCFGVRYGVCDFVVLSVVEVCADYGGVHVFHVVSILASSMVLGFVSMSVVWSVLLYVGCFLLQTVVCCDVVCGVL